MTTPDDRPRLLTEVDGDVWRITLDRPEAGNALDHALADQLKAAFQQRPEQTRARQPSKIADAPDAETVADAPDNRRQVPFRGR